MQAAAAGGVSVSWAAVQPSVLGRSAPALGTGRTSGGGGGGGGGCTVRPVGMVVRCCARTQEKRPPRVRKTKEERREMVESFVNAYRVSNDGKFPSVNLTHKEVGGSYYIVREIVRDIIQENRVLGPGGLDATALSFEDCPDSSELEMKHKLGGDSMEILNASGGNLASKDSVVETRNVNLTLSHKNAISVQTMLGSSGLLEAGVLNSVVQNGSAAGTSYSETSHENQDEVSCEKSGEADHNTSEEQVPSFNSVSDSDKESDIDSLVKACEGTSSSITDGTVPCSEPSAAYETNGALLQEQDTLHIDCHGGTADNAVNEENVLAETNGGLHTQNHEALLGSVSTDDVQILDDHASSTAYANQTTGSYFSKSSQENEATIKTIEPSEVHRLQHELEQPLLNASSQEQEKSESVVSHPALDTKELLQREDKVDESDFKRSTSEIIKEDADKSDAQHEQGTGTTTTISSENVQSTAEERGEPILACP
ncbi:hypothetical protein ACP4OV_028141 [Aristida adscensionis]